ncbi:MAG TPA: flagellar export chaperone FliS [Bacillota bacterium]|nr:flagellar export chaperone FliS [Bacillota bacterium]
MASRAAYQTYQNNAVNTASGGDLTLMLYNGCIRFIKQAMKDIEANHFESKNTHIQKAQNIIQELMLTLDPAIELSKQMMPIYDYINFQLQEANIKNDRGSLEEALEFVTEFRDTWKQVIAQTRKAEYAQGAQV